MEGRSTSTNRHQDSLRDLDEELHTELPGYLAANSMGGFICDLGEGRLSLMPGALAALDFGPGEFDGRITALRERVLREDLPNVLEKAASALAGSGDSGVYFRIRARDRRTHWVHAQASVRRDRQGRAVRAVGTVRNADAELRHAAQQAVLASERSRPTGVVQAVATALASGLTVEDLLAYATSPAFLDTVAASGAALSVLELGALRATGLPAGLVRDNGAAEADSPLPVGEAISRRTPFFLTRGDIREHYPMLWPYIEPTDLTASAILPLAARGLKTGALSIFFSREQEFPPDERDLLTTIGAIFAQSLQRSLLYDQEHAMSVALQQSLLPACMPDPPGLGLAVRYQPARFGHQVGGDWYDATLTPSGAIVMVVGDVQGHDAQAAAVMGQLRTALRAYAAEGYPPSVVMARASMFLGELDTELIATCVCAHVDPVSGDTEFVRAGHPHPILRSAGRRSSLVEVAGGLPLGLAQFGDGSYPTTRIRLNDGDTLLMCTDGLLESRGSDLGAGERRIRALLDEGPADLEGLADHIIAARDNEQAQEDDIALLLALLEGAGGRGATGPAGPGPDRHRRR